MGYIYHGMFLIFLAPPLPSRRPHGAGSTLRCDLNGVNIGFSYNSTIDRNTISPLEPISPLQPLFFCADPQFDFTIPFHCQWSVQGPSNTAPSLREGGGGRKGTQPLPFDKLRDPV